MTSHPEAIAVSRGGAQCPHLLPALAALLVVGLAVEGVEIFMRWHLPRRLNFFAQQMNTAKVLGNVLQTTAFRTPNVLPIYGSSELKIPVNNRAEEFFLTHREGFRVFPIGLPGNTCLLILEKLAAAGPAVRGKKVGIFLSPNWFLRQDVRTAQVHDNVTPIQLGAWVFGHGLSDGFKRRFARRLLTRPEGLEKDPLLTLCLRCLAGDSVADRCRLALLTPVGHLNNLWLTHVDYWTELRDLWVLPEPAGPAAQCWWQPAEPLAEAGWQRLAEEAEARERQHPPETPYSVLHPTGLDNDPSVFPVHHRGAGERDSQFAARLDRSSEWEDLALLIDGLKELGADAAFISQPFNGIYHDLSGHGEPARRHYYDKLDGIVRPSGFPLIDFSDHDQDLYFFNDAVHPSGKAWIFYDHALDDFYHGRGAFAAPRQ